MPRGGYRGGKLPLSSISFLTVFLTWLAILPLVQASDATPNFLIHTRDGQDINGSLHRIDKDGTIHLTGEPRRRVPGLDLISLRQKDRRLPAPPLSAQVILAAGDRLPLLMPASVQLRDEKLVLQPSGPLQGTPAGKLTIPVSYVAMIWLRSPEGVADREVELRRWLKRPRLRDVVLMTNGDQVEGTVLSLDGQTVCRLQNQRQTIELPCDRIAAVAFSTALLLRPRLQESYAQVVLSDGGRLHLQSMELTNPGPILTGQTLFRQEVRLPLTDVLALDIRQGAAVYLSDLKPAHYLHTPFLDVSWPLVEDGSVAGGALTLGEDVYDKGLGMHSAAEVTYNLEGKYSWFETVVGLDRYRGRKGHVRISIHVDGHPHEQAEMWELNGEQPPRFLRIAVPGAKRLTLKVHFGPAGDIQDHVNWINARLIRSGKR